MSYHKWQKPIIFSIIPSTYLWAWRSMWQPWLPKYEIERESFQNCDCLGHNVMPWKKKKQVNSNASGSVKLYYVMVIQFMVCNIFWWAGLCWCVKIWKWQCRSDQSYILTLYFIMRTLLCFTFEFSSDFCFFFQIYSLCPFRISAWT